MQIGELNFDKSPTESTASLPRCRQRPERAGPSQPPTPTLGGVLAAIFLVPLFLGGRHPWGHFMLVMTAGVAFALWVLAELQKTPSEFPAERGWMDILGRACACRASNHSLATRRASDHYTSNSRVTVVLGERARLVGTSRGWCYVSLTPWETCYSLILFVAYGVLFYVSIQVLRERSDIFGLLEWIAVAGVSAAVLAWVQLGVGTDKFLGIFEYPFRKASEYLTGSFTTKNHFGHFLVLTLGPLPSGLPGLGGSSLQVEDILCWPGGQPPGSNAGKSFWPGITPAIDSRITFSWGNSGFGNRRHLFHTYRSESQSTKTSSGNFPADGKPGGRCGCSRISGRGILSPRRNANLRRLGTNRPSRARRTIWSTVIRALPDFAPLGAGVGSLREVYPIYLTRHDFPRYFTHAESGYLQIALEVGFPGTVLLADRSGHRGGMGLDKLVAGQRS